MHLCQYPKNPQNKQINKETNKPDSFSETQIFNLTAEITHKLHDVINPYLIKAEEIEKPRQSGVLYIWYWLSAFQGWSGLIRFPAQKGGHDRREEKNRNAMKPRTTRTSASPSHLCKSNWILTTIKYSKTYKNISRWKDKYRIIFWSSSYFNIISYFYFRFLPSGNLRLFC